MPLTTRVEGIDVSHWQGDIDWSSVYNSGKKFAFAKATEGVGFIDPNFDKNMNEAHAASATDSIEDASVPAECSLLFVADGEPIEKKKVCSCYHQKEMIGGQEKVGGNKKWKK